MASTQDENRPSRRSKSADAFRTISEVSDDVGVPQHVLRFWETKFTQIKPLKRGGGRRYYRPEDIELLNQIRAWLYDDGYTIKGVQKLLKEGGLPVASAGRKPGSDKARSAQQEEADDAEPADAEIAEEDEADSGKVRAATQQPVSGNVLRPADQSAHSSAAERADEVRAQDVKESRSAAIQSAALKSAAGTDIDGAAADEAGTVGRGAVYDRQARADDGADEGGAAASRQTGALVGVAGVDQVALDGVIESLEEIRDQLRGPPPEP